jgi:alpha-galactosidase
VITVEQRPTAEGAGVRIVIIGGGSFQWVPTLATDLALTPSVRGAEIVLEDIDASRLGRTAPVVEHINGLTDAHFTVTTTTDQREALRGADFVLVNITTGGFASMQRDLDVPWRYGIRQPGGDTMGPGGISRALRNIPVMLSIARDMEDVCPDAWLLNLTNPMTALCRAVTKMTAIKTVGLCHEVTNFRGVLCLLTGADWNAIDLAVTGVNHVPIVTAIDLGDGRDGMAELRAIAHGDVDLDVDLGFDLGDEYTQPGSSGGEPRPRRATKRWFVEDYAAGFELFRRFGAFVAPGNRHTLEAFPAFLAEDADGGERWNVHYTTIAERKAHEEQYAADLDRRLADTAPGYPSLEMAAPVIDSLLTGRTRTLPLNIPNAGQCPDLPNAAVTESMCIVDEHGVRGATPVAAPPFFAAWLNRIVAAQECTVEAAGTGNRELVHAAMLLDPHAGTLGLATIEQMTAELLEATQQWLPQFEAATSRRS